MRLSLPLLALCTLLLIAEGCVQGDVPIAPPPSASLKLVGMLDGNGTITHIRFSPDGTTVATISGKEDEGLTLWNASTRKKLWTRTTGYRHAMHSVEFSHDGSMIATGSNKHIDITSHELTAAYIWSTANGSLMSQCTQLYGTIETLAFIPGDSVLATSGGDLGEVKLWEPRSGTELGKIGFSSNTTLDFSPDGRYLIGSPVTLIDVRKRNRIDQPWFELHSHNAVQALSPDGSRIIGADLAHDPDTYEPLRSIAIADFNSGEYLGMIRDRSSSLGEVVKIKVARDMSTFGVLDEWGALSIYRLSNGELLATSTEIGEVSDFDFGSTGSTVALALGVDGGGVWTIE